MNQAVWLSALGAVLALDHAMVGQMMLSQPLVVGGIFGYCLGDVTTGLLVGALVQLLWIGVLPVGAYVPADHTVTGGITVVLTQVFIHHYGFSLAPSLVYALGVAIPAGVLSGKLDVAVRHLNSRLAKNAEKVVDQYGGKGLDGINLAGLIPTFLRNFSIYLLWLIPGAMLAAKVYSSFPPPVIKGLSLAFWSLPVISFAVILELIANDQVGWWVLGTFILAWLLLLIWPGQSLGLFTLALAVGALVAWWRKEW